MQKALLLLFPELETVFSTQAFTESKKRYLGGMGSVSLLALETDKYVDLLRSCI